MKKIENRPGQNNCFLNVVIQSLWHLPNLQNSISSIKQHYHSKFCISCSLKVLKK